MDWLHYAVQGFWLLIAVLVIAGLVDRVRRKDWPAVKRYLSCLGVGGVLVVGFMLYLAYAVIDFTHRRMCSSTPYEMAAWAGALELYRSDVADSAYPATLLQLYSDNVPGWAGPYVATITPDPWDNQYQYQSDGSSFTITSAHKPPFSWWSETGPVIITRTTSDTTNWR